MVQSIESVSRPVYNAVNIKITKPEVNTPNSDKLTVVNDNGIYNAVKINIDNPTIKTEPACTYPENNEIITYDMLNLNPVTLPQGFPVAASYYEASVFVPEDAKDTNQDTVQIAEEEPVEQTIIPPANYTTIEAEKGEQSSAKESSEKESQGVQFKAAPQTELKKPEIVPAEPILPAVDISAVKENLESKDFDVQAKQIEEIARVSLDNPQNAVPYIVKDVFTDLIDIAKKDTSKLQAPSEKQIEIRKQIITNFITAEIAKAQNKPAQAPYNISKADIELANEISPMEQAERNKEYAIYTLAILSKVYIDEIQKETGNVVPFTDVPGLSDIVDELRKNSNPSVKIAAIDGLRYLNRPEYKDELNTIFTIAMADKNPQVAAVAVKSIQKINANS